MEQKKNKSPSKTNNKTNRTRQIVRLAGVIVILLAILITLWLLLRGKTTVSGAYPENVKSISLKCTSSSASYKSKIGSLSEDSKRTEVTSIFYEDGTFGSISLEHTLYFSSRDAASSAEAVAHANFNFALRASSYDTNKFDNKFTILDNKLVVAVHGKKSDWNSFNHDYFMIQSEEMPATFAELKTTYENQGFSCETIE